jgi:hypothetical protein
MIGNSSVSTDRSRGVFGPGFAAHARRWLQDHHAAVLYGLAAFLVAGSIYVLLSPSPFGDDELTLSERISLCAYLAAAGTLLATVPQLVSIAQTARSTHYSQLDDRYHDLLKLCVVQPGLRKPGAGDAEGYESYAFMVYNFLETVRDRCETDEMLKSIWAPVIALEHSIHRDWFYKETDCYLERFFPKFRIQFVDFMYRLERGGHLCGNELLDDGGWIHGSWRPREAGTILDEKKAETRWLIEHRANASRN